MALAVDMVPLFLRMDDNILALTTRFCCRGGTENDSRGCYLRGVYGNHRWG